MSDEMKDVDSMKKAGEKPVKKVSLNSFFTREQEDNGVWFRPQVTNADGERMPIELCVVSTNSDRAQEAIDRYQAELQKIPEGVERSTRVRDLLVKQMARCVVGIRTVAGYDVSLDDGTVEYSEKQTERLLSQSAPLLNEVIAFCRNVDNFIVGRTS